MSVVENQLKGMHRRAGKTLKTVASVNETKLSQENKSRLFALSAQAGVCRQFAGKPARKKLEAIEQNGGPRMISMAETLKMFE